MGIGQEDSGARGEERKRLLVVDGEHAICAFVTAVLEDIGYAVSGAATGREARTIAARGGIACALVEIMLPDGSGENLAEDMARLGIPVILTSGHPDGVRSGSTSRHTFLQKPFSVASLVRVVVDQAVDEAIQRS
jgi:two-component system, OmpR family, response regulator